MNETGKKKQVREPPSVPFLWEVKPGITRKDWKPEFSLSSVSQVPKSPLKLIASVPFAWEEKPGKPIPNFSQMSVESAPPNQQAEFIYVASSSRYSVACNYGHDIDTDKTSSSDEDYGDSSYTDDNETVAGMDPEAFSFETNESFSSFPSLLSNCHVPSAKISTAIPLQKSSLSELESIQMESPPSPASETSSSTTSYATGRSSPAGASFLEALFPLFPPNSGFLEKATSSENISSTPLEVKGKTFGHEDNAGVMARRPPTLGELIMMSQRRSYRRQASQMRKWDTPMDIGAKKAFGCCNFVTTKNMIEGLLKRKYFPRLKLI